MILGIDIGGTNIKLGALSSSNKIKYRSGLRTKGDANDKEFLLSLEKAILNLISEFRSNESLHAIGIGSPGPLDSERGIIYQTANLKNLKNCKIKSYLEKKIGVSVHLENDANCAAMGHKIFGLGKKTADFAVITLGTGVGGGLILNDQLFTGQGNAFEIGHVPLADRGFLDTEYYVKCGCKRMGCLETFASASAVVNMYNTFQKKKKRRKKVRFPKEVADLVHKNDANARKVFKILGRSLGLVSSHLIQNLNLPLIIFTGGLSASSDLFSEELESTVQERVFPVLYQKTKIKYTVGNEDFAILGAASLCF